MAIPSQKRRTHGAYVTPKFVPGKGFTLPMALMARAQLTGTASEPQVPQEFIGMLLGQANIPVSGGAGAAINAAANVPLYGIQMPMTARNPVAIMLFPTAVYGGYAQIFGCQTLVNHYGTQTQGQGPTIVVIPTGTTLKSLQALVTVTGKQPASGTLASSISVSVGGIMLSLLSLPQQNILNSADLSVGSGTQTVPVVPNAS